MTSPRPQLDQHHSAVLDVLPYAMLAFCVLVSFALHTTTERRLITGLILSAVTAAWMLWMFTLHPALAATAAGDGGVHHRADPARRAPGPR